MTVDDAQAVLWTADVLEKSEFEVFEEAYRAWYQEAADIHRLERIFADYMFDEIVPFWVRQFTRETLDRHDGWQRDEELTVRQYLGMYLGTVTATVLATAGLAASLFLPHVVFGWIEADFAAFPA